MNQLIASILLALGVGKQVQKSDSQTQETTNKNNNFTLPKGFEHLQTGLNIRRAERQRAERRQHIRSVIMIVLIFGAFGGIFVVAALYNTGANRPLSQEEKDDARFDAMSCTEQKDYVESHLNQLYVDTGSYEYKYAERAWMEYNGTHWFNVHGISCHPSLGYLKGDENYKVCQMNSFTCDYWFPRDADGTVHFPKDWYWSDSKTGQKIVDPNIYFQMENVNLKGVIDN